MPTGKHPTLKCVLLVDDDRVTNFLNKRILELDNVAEHVHISQNGEEALNFIKENCEEPTAIEHNCPDLVLLDINMPVMDGFQFLAAVEAVRKNMKIVVLTSSLNPQDVKMANQFPISGYISKPLSTPKLAPFLS